MELNSFSSHIGPLLCVFAAAFLQSTVGCITIVAANLLVKKIDPEAGLF